MTKVGKQVHVTDLKKKEVKKHIKRKQGNTRKYKVHKNNGFLVESFI